MPGTYNILIMGASYGSLLASKLLFGGHQVKLVCLPAEADLINAEGFRVRLPVKGRNEPIEIDSRKLPGKVSACGPADVDPTDYEPVLVELRRTDGRLSRATRTELAAKAFACTARYDAAISTWFAMRTYEGFPPAWRDGALLHRLVYYRTSPGHHQLGLASRVPGTLSRHIEISSSTRPTPPHTDPLKGDHHALNSDVFHLWSEKWSVRGVTRRRRSPMRSVELRRPAYRFAKFITGTGGAR